MTPQGSLDRIRSSYGAGMANIRNSDQRSADQNSTQSGNPNLVNNYASPMARQNFYGSLAQDPTNIRNQSNYMAPQPSAAAPAPAPPQPASRLTPAQVQAMLAQYRPVAPANAGAPQTGYAAYNSAANALGQLQPNTATMPNGYNTPSPSNPQVNLMGAPVQTASGNGYTPRNLAAGPSGYRYVRPMVR